MDNEHLIPEAAFEAATEAAMRTLDRMVETESDVYDAMSDGLRAALPHILAAIDANRAGGGSQ